MSDQVDSSVMDGFGETLDSGSPNDSSPQSVHLDSASQPQTLGDYTLFREIARGGMGVVYHARHDTLGREVALKLILSGEFASENDVRRFHLEAESAAALDHPGIVPIFEIGQESGHHFFTMKLISGGSLSAKMPEFRDHPRRLAALLIEVADAIDFAHRRGILHRDLKPANILLDENDRPVVTDLGLAKHTHGDSDLTGTGAIVGTPAYMPPEQARASKQITTAVDVYAIGAILYDGLAGRPPQQAESAIATLMQAAKGDVQPLSQHAPKVDRVLELICMKCLAREPQQRYASAAALADDLRAWLAGESVSVKPKSITSALGDLVSGQLRSAIGAMLLGVCGGLALGVPVYAGLAGRLFDGPNPRFNLRQLQTRLPSAGIEESWWLRPPEFLSGPAAFMGLAFCCVLGLLIQKLVKPADVRQALAIGLVAGLLMAIIEFAMYGIAASWQTFAIVNADQVQQLVDAGFGEQQTQQNAIKALFEKYPELETLPRDQRSEALTQLISTQIMLSSVPVSLGCLVGCLIFASVYCVLGTVHAFRLKQAAFSLSSRLLRYFEVIGSLSLAGLFGGICVFTLFGMITSADGPVGLSHQVLVPLALFLCSAIPGWLLARWQYRWLSYLAVGGILYFLFHI